MQHKFNVELPLYPNKPREGEAPFKLEMDGKPLSGVTDITLRAGANGFTNMILGFEAGAAVRCTAELIAHADMTGSEQRILDLAEIYRDVTVEVVASVAKEGGTIDNTLDAQAHFVKRIIEMTLERLGSL